MKTKYIYLLLCIIGIVMGGCKDDSADNPAFRDDEAPYIYTDMKDKISAIAGTPAEYPILVSPADGNTTVTWLLDGEVIGNISTLTYTFPQPGIFKLRIEAKRNGLLNYREFTLTVTAP